MTETSSSVRRHDQSTGYRTRLREMRARAEEVLAHYDLAETRLTLLAHASETTFLVTAGAARYTLRLYPSMKVSRSQVRSELLWLEAISGDTDLVVPAPLRTRDGDVLAGIPASAWGVGVIGVLCRWVEGRFFDAGLRPMHLERVGMLQARLHAHARTWRPPAGFARPTWSWKWYFGEVSVANPAFVARHGSGHISDREQAIFAATAAKVEAMMRSLPQCEGDAGLIHGDLQQTNYLFYRGQARAIDFGDCCFGPFLFDMSIPLFEVSLRPQREELTAAFFRGYQRVRPLPPQSEERLQLYTAIRLVKRVNYLLRAENPKLRTQAEYWLAYASRWLERFLHT